MCYIEWFGFEFLHSKWSMFFLMTKKGSAIKEICFSTWTLWSICFWGQLLQVLAVSHPSASPKGVPSNIIYMGCGRFVRMNLTSSKRSKGKHILLFLGFSGLWISQCLSWILERLIWNSTASGHFQCPASRKIVLRNTLRALSWHTFLNVKTQKCELWRLYLIFLLLFIYLFWNSSKLWHLKKIDGGFQLKLKNLAMIYKKLLKP